MSAKKYQLTRGQSKDYDVFKELSDALIPEEVRLVIIASAWMLKTRVSITSLYDLWDELKNSGWIAPPDKYGVLVRLLNACELKEASTELRSVRANMYPTGKSLRLQVEDEYHVTLMIALHKTIASAEEFDMLKTELKKVDLPRKVTSDRSICNLVQLWRPMAQYHIIPTTFQENGYAKLRQALAASPGLGTQLATLDKYLHNFRQNSSVVDTKERLWVKLAIIYNRLVAPRLIGYVTRMCEQEYTLNLRTRSRKQKNEAPPTYETAVAYAHDVLHKYCATENPTFDKFDLSALCSTISQGIVRASLDLKEAANRVREFRNSLAHPKQNFEGIDQEYFEDCVGSARLLVDLVSEDHDILMAFDRAVQEVIVNQGDGSIASSQSAESLKDFEQSIVAERNRNHNSGENEAIDLALQSLEKVVRKDAARLDYNSHLLCPDLPKTMLPPMLRKFTVFLQEQLEPRPLLIRTTHITSEFIPAEKEESFKHEKIRERQVWMFFGLLFPKDAKSYDDRIKALKLALKDVKEQKFICDFLEGTYQLDGPEMEAIEKCKKVLDDNRPMLVGNLYKPGAYVDDLADAGLLSDGDISRLRAYDDATDFTDGIVDLLNIIKRRGPKALEVLLSAIKREQPHLISELK